MIEVKYNREKNSTIVITHDLSVIEEHVPIKVKLRNIVTKEIHFETELYSNMWSHWVGAELITDVLFYSKNGVLIHEYKWDVMKDGDDIEKNLWIYLQGRKALGLFSNGLVIGTHDGRNGHWIYPILEGLSKATLIDGSTEQFSKLKQNYKDNKNVRFINEIVTVDGSDVIWYQGGEGYTDTVVKELIVGWVGGQPIRESYRKSLSFNELLEKENFDWVHLDVEGIDADLILSMTKRPNVIIYESMNLGSEISQKLSDWFSNKNYRTLTCFGNTIAIKLDNEN